MKINCIDNNFGKNVFQMEKDIGPRSRANGRYDRRFLWCC
jgi:hypothetical protein